MLVTRWCCNRSTPDRRKLLLTAKAYGLSNLVLWDQAGHSQMYSFSADMDNEEVRTAFQKQLSGRGNRRGDAGREDVSLWRCAERCGFPIRRVKMATQYAKDVVNGLRVVPPHGKQVELKLRIVEVDRSKAEQFGINSSEGGWECGELAFDDSSFRPR